jgi:hypothetical protein
MTETKPRASRRILAILITFAVVVLIVAVEQFANHDADQATTSSTESQQEPVELQKGDDTRQRAIAIILRDYEANPFLLEHSVPGSGYQDEVDRDGWWALRTSQCQNCVDVSLPFLVTDATGKNQFTRVSFLVDMSQQAVVSITMPTRQLLRAKNDRVKTPKIETVSLMLSSKRATQLMTYLGTLYLVYGTQFHGGHWTETELECPDPTHVCFRLTYGPAANGQGLSWLIDNVGDREESPLRPEGEESEQLDRLSRRYPDAEIYWTCAGIGCPYPC